jgi:hypothetical protein
MLTHGWDFTFAKQTTRAIQAWLGHASVNNTVIDTALAQDQFEGFRRRGVGRTSHSQINRAASAGAVIVEALFEGGSLTLLGIHAANGLPFPRRAIRIHLSSCLNEEAALD